MTAPSRRCSPASASRARAQQLACGLGWTLNRTVGALQRLEANLANTGQTLTRLGHQSYLLGPRPRLVDDRQIARCLRHDHKPLNVTAATVLHCALTRPREERAREALRAPAEDAAAERLIAAGLLEDTTACYDQRSAPKRRSRQPLIAAVSGDPKGSLRVAMMAALPAA